MPKNKRPTRPPTHFEQVPLEVVAKISEAGRASTAEVPAVPRGRPAQPTATKPRSSKRGT